MTMAWGSAAPVPHNDGRGLELAVASYFHAHGYDVATNVVREGRSGGRHEIDVLALRHDPLATVSIAVECKDWQQPVEKDVVSKLHYVLGDLGVNKGVIVSRGGFRRGADHAAAQLSIDLWGPEEISPLLCAAHHESALGAAPITRELLGWEFRVGPDQAARSIAAAARGSVILRRQESIVDVVPVWVPVHLASITVTEIYRKWGRSHYGSRLLSNAYDAFGHQFIGEPVVPPELQDQGTVATIPATRRPTKIKSMLEGAVRRALRVTTEAAQERHRAMLASLGIPVDCADICVNEIEIAHQPMWIGLLRRRGIERFVAIDAITGAENSVVSLVLTSRMEQIRSVIG